MSNGSYFDHLKGDPHPWDNGYGFFIPPGMTQITGASEAVKSMSHPHWHKFPPNNPAWDYIFGLLYITMYIISMFGNGLVIYLFVKAKNLRSPANMLVVNLAVADFFMMQTQAPMYIVTVFSSRWWIFNFLWCKSYAFAGSVTGIAAILTMVFIGYDRYNVIVKGINGPVVTKLKAAMFIIFIWAYAVGISLPPLLEVWGSYALEGMLTTCGIDYLTETFKVRSYLLFIFSGSYVLCLSSLVFFYSQIVSAVWTHEKTLKEQAKKMNVASLRSNAEAGGQSAEFRIAKVALINVLIWVCAWTPYGAVSMIGAFGNREIVYPLVGQLPSLATKFASCFNPLIYAISHPKFRLALKEYAPWVCINEQEIKPSSDSSSEKTVTSS